MRGHLTNWKSRVQYPQPPPIHAEHELPLEISPPQHGLTCSNWGQRLNGRELWNTRDTSLEILFYFARDSLVFFRHGGGVSEGSPLTQPTWKETKARFPGIHCMHFHVFVPLYNPHYYVILYPRSCGTYVMSKNGLSIRRYRKVEPMPHIFFVFLKFFIVYSSYVLPASMLRYVEKGVLWHASVFITKTLGEHDDHIFSIFVCAHCIFHTYWISVLYISIFFMSLSTLIHVDRAVCTERDLVAKPTFINKCLASQGGHIFLVDFVDRNVNAHLKQSYIPVYRLISMICVPRPFGTCIRVDTAWWSAVTDRCNRLAINVDRLANIWQQTHRHLHLWRRHWYSMWKSAATPTFVY